MSNFGSKSDTKRVALIGANKDALALLPLLFSDPATRLVMVVDPNPDAMLFKLMELGYRIASRHMVAVSTDLEELKKIKDLDAIINVLKDPATERFLGEKAFAGVEKLSPMSAKLLWNVRANTDKDSDKDSNEKVNKPKAINQATVLTPLRDIVDAVRLTHDRDELLTDILDIAIETTHAETGSVMLITKEDGKPILVMEVARGMDEEVIRKVRVPLGEGVAGKVARDGEPRIISGEAKDGDFPRALPRQRLRGARRKVKSAISVPLTVGVNIIGVINVNSSESNHVFIDEDLNLLTTLAGLAAEVIQKSSEHDRLKLDAAKFSLWKTLELNMSERKPLYKRLVMVCRHLAELVSGLTCFVYTYDDEKKKLTLNASSMKDSPAGGHLNFAYGEGIEGYLIGAMKEVILVDRSSDGAANKCVYMALPMAVKDDAVGVFVAQIVSPQGLSKYNESFLKEMTKLLGESIYTHRNNEADLARSHSIVKVDEMGLELIAMK
ncbi:MAG: GAF domain-containing protein, partial [Deltaproteobacteria bacterium]|nr:GAF domain-containing protein [Deltaproteobacteria bacterium]